MFNYQGSLTDSVSIAENSQNSHYLNLSENVSLLDSLVTIPTPIFNTKAVSDTFGVTEAIDKFDVGAGFSSGLTLQEARAMETKKVLASALLISDSSAEHNYPFTYIKWMGACHGGL